MATVLEELEGWNTDLVEAVKKFPRALNWTIVEDSVEPRWISNGGKASPPSRLLSFPGLELC
jgi:hypothetical protein